jgi:hypothetical protein
MGDSAYRFYSSKALQNWSQMFWEHPGRWCSIYRTPTLPLAAKSNSRVNGSKFILSTYATQSWKVRCEKTYESEK